MAWSFGDSFDLYAAPADATGSYWDTSSATGINIVAGRFAGSQAFGWSTTINQTLVKTSGVNDAVHHLAMAFQQTATITGSTLGLSLQLFDGATAQCSVVFRSDGAILLTSGGPAGTALATYTGAFSIVSTWYAFEIEVVINNTTGSFSVRKNGNTVNDFSATSLNTRGGTANNYVNKLQIAENAAVAQQRLDDFFWQSGAATGTWLGDIRCYARMPASDVQKQFTPLSGTTNFSQVSEAHEDGLTSYVFDSNPGDADFYGIGSIASTPATVLATTIRAYMQKSDAGTRTAAVQLKSGATTVASPTLVLTTSGWLWAWRTDLVDPATGLAWTSAAVNNAQVGPKTIA